MNNKKYNMDSKKVFCYFDKDANFVEADMKLKKDADRDLLEKLADKNSKYAKVLNSKLVDMYDIYSDIKASDNADEKSNLIEVANYFLSNFDFTVRDNNIYSIKEYNYNAMFRADRRFNNGNFAKKTHSAVYNRSLLDATGFDLDSSSKKMIRK